MLEQYGVARGTLREALRFLEIQGVITIKTGPGGGPMVARPESRHLASTIAMMLQLTHTSFRSVLEARAVLEPALARRAAERITDESLKTLHDSLDAMREHIDDVDFFLAENERFHALVAEAAGNQVFALLITSLNWICRRHAARCRVPDRVTRGGLQRARADLPGDRPPRLGTRRRRDGGPHRRFRDLPGAEVPAGRRRAAAMGSSRP